MIVKRWFRKFFKTISKPLIIPYSVLSSQRVHIPIIDIKKIKKTLVFLALFFKKRLDLYTISVVYSEYE